MAQESKFDQKKADAICAMVSEGKSLRKACEEAAGKHSTFLDWCNKSTDLADQYTRAREIGRALRFERLREIAATDPERDEKGRIDPGWVAWKKMEIDTEKWSLSKEEPKKYGDKVAIGGSDDMPPIKTWPDEVLMARIAALQAKLDGK